jgi:hypothetical protein
MLAFVTSHRLWLMDSAYGLVRAPVRVGRTVVGVGFVPGGRRVVAVNPRRSSFFDAATGARVR